VLIRSLAHEIVMSMPALYKKGGAFLLFPSRRAVKVIGKRYREYVAKILMKVADELPIAARVVMDIQAIDD